MPKKEKRRNAPIDREEEEFNRQVRARHIELFSEEYDHMFDSMSDARERRLGHNPMQAAHLESVNKSRKEMGFEPLSESGYATSNDTFKFVESMMRAGKDIKLQDLVASRAKAELDAELEKELARQKLQTPSWLDKNVDEMLASEIYNAEKQDSSDHNLIAFCILGALFNVNKNGSNETEFFRQIHRVLPNRTKAEYEGLYRHAMNEWMEAYGY